jgi:hypothetical protein
MAALLGCALVAQLSPMGGSPLPSNSLVVPVPPGGAGSVLVKLPPSFGVRSRLPAHHGTEIYKLPVWSVGCPQHGRATKPALVEAVTSVVRRGLVNVMQTVSGSYDYPLSCRLAAVRGRYVLIFYDPGRRRSPALATRGPDYTVP